MLSNDLILSRHDLYELAWSKPMQELAKDFGITSVGMAKRCRGLGVPVPRHGYWVRIGAGRPPADPDEPLGPEALMIPSFTPVTRIEDVHLIIRRTALAEGLPGAENLPFRLGDKPGVVVGEGVMRI